MGFSKWVHLDVDRIAAVTENALLLEIDGDEYWIPKSQIDEPDKYDRGDTEVTVSITEWIAKQKGLGDWPASSPAPIRVSAPATGARPSAPRRTRNVPMRSAETGLICELCSEPAIHCDSIPDASVPGYSPSEAGYRLQPLCMIHAVDRRQVATSRVNQILRCERQGIGRLDRGRAAGASICTYCSRAYRRHPTEQDHPFLNVLCDGSVVKL